VPTITTHVWNDNVSQPWKPPDEFPVAVEPGRIFTANAQEVERIQGGPGAVILLTPGLPLPFTGYEHHPPAIHYTRMVVNGKVVAARSGAGARELVLEETLRCDRSSWVAARTFEPSARSEVFGHTSPVYLLVERRPVVVKEAVRELLQKLDRLVEHTERLQGFRQESHRKETLDVYRRAREVLQRRLDASP
jgi:hypothetical protein